MLPTKSATDLQDSVRKIRVMHLVSTLNIGGLEKVVYDLTRLRNREQFEVKVVCLGEVGALGSSFESEGIDISGLEVIGKGKFRVIRKLVAEMRRSQPDVLHTHNPAPHLVGAIAARLARVPVVVHTKHGRNYPNNSRKVWANRIATWFSHRVVAVSNNAADVARDVEHISPRKVEVVFNGIDLERFSEAHSLSDVNACRAIHVARLMDPPKDHGTLLQATKLVVDEVPEFRLDIVGDGPDREKIEKLCDDLGLRQHVTFHGFRHDIHELLKECGLFILSTTTEGLSITLLEAMATGLPIVATCVGGNPEVVIENETGLLVPAKSPREMANAILSLARDPGRAHRLGAAGRARVEEHFDLRKVVARYEELYRDLLATKGCRR